MAQTHTATALPAAGTATKPQTKSATVKPKRADTDVTEAFEKVMSGEDEVVIYKNGKKAGAVISARAHRFLVKATEEEMDRRDIEEAERRLSDPSEKTVPYEDVRKELGLA